MLKDLYCKVQAFMLSDEGATAIEYGLIAAGIAVTIGGVVFTVGGSVEGLMTEVSDMMQGAGN